MGAPMHGWEYRKLDLNDRARKAKETDLLNDAGSEGWEVVAITANHIAYLKRQVGRPAYSSRSKASET
jgi:hypothetical protein